MRTQKGRVFLPPHISSSLSGFGFLASKEVKAAGVGNLGLQDREYIIPRFLEYLSHLKSTERFALEWVQKYISNFGGDPSKVTMNAIINFLSIALMRFFKDGASLPVLALSRCSCCTMVAIPGTCSAVHSCSLGILCLSALWNKGKYTTTIPLSKLTARQLRILSIVYAQYRMMHCKRYSIKCLALSLIRYVPFRVVDEGDHS